MRAEQSHASPPGGALVQDHASGVGGDWRKRRRGRQRASSPFGSGGCARDASFWWGSATRQARGLTRPYGHRPSFIFPLCPAGPTNLSMSRDPGGQGCHGSGGRGDGWGRRPRWVVWCSSSRPTTSSRSATPSSPSSWGPCRQGRPQARWLTYRRLLAADRAYGRCFAFCMSRFTMLASTNFLQALRFFDSDCLIFVCISHGLGLR